MAIELLPTRAVYPPGEDVVVEARGVGAPGVVTVFHLGDDVRTERLGESNAGDTRDAG